MLVRVIVSETFAVSNAYCTPPLDDLEKQKKR